MKRGGRLVRKTGLKAKAPLTSASRLQRSALIGSQIKTRRPSVSREEREARRIVRARSGGVCEVCGRERATNFQHRQNRSQLGDWTASNGLDVCGTGTTGCHGRIHQNPRISYERGWSVRSTASPAVTPVWLASRGWSLLDDAGGVTPIESSAA